MVSKRRKRSREINVTSIQYKVKKDNEGNIKAENYSSTIPIQLAQGLNPPLKKKTKVLWSILSDNSLKMEIVLEKKKGG